LRCGVRGGSGSTRRIKPRTARVLPQRHSVVEIHELHGLPRDMDKALGIFVGRVTGAGRLLLGRRAVATEAERGRKRSRASTQPQISGDSGTWGRLYVLRVIQVCSTQDALVHQYRLKHKNGM
jgi:hypothetical protein